MSKEISDKLDRLEGEIKAIKERNRLVEAKKAWETSIARKISIALITYILMVIVFVSTGSTYPLLAAIAPTLGFILSTLSLDFIRNLWQKRNPS